MPKCHSQILSEDLTMKSIRAIAAISVALTSGIAWANAEKPPIVLVHGAWETAGIWQGVEARLKADGYRVTVVSLPGRTGNPAPPETMTLDSYRDVVLKSMQNLHQPVVLVGHSFGGFTISSVAEAAPEKVRTLVYLAAYLPTDKQTLLDLGNSDRDSKIGPHLQVMKDKGIIAIEHGARADLFCNDCSAAARAAIPDQIVDEPLIPLTMPIHLDPARFAAVDKVYIRTAKDQVVSPWLQSAMLEATPVRLVLTENTGHTAFLTDPDGVAKNIEHAAKASRMVSTGSGSSSILAK
jgi:pimeloyl-ACP methyl ester carboxylesterase